MCEPALQPEHRVRRPVDFFPSVVLLPFSASSRRSFLSQEMSEFYEARLVEAGVVIEKNVTAERLWGLEEQVMCTCV